MRPEEAPTPSVTVEVVPAHQLQLLHQCALGTMRLVKGTTAINFFRTLYYLLRSFSYELCGFFPLGYFNYLEKR